MHVVPANACLGRPLLLAALFLATSTAVAQPIFEHVDSLEWKAADSKVIVRATIVEVTRDPGESNYEWETVTLKVDETLQGAHEQTIRFVVRMHKSDDGLTGWMNEERKLLVFLVDSQRFKKTDVKYTRHPLALRQLNWRRSCITPGRDSRVPLYTMGVETLTEVLPSGTSLL